MRNPKKIPSKRPDTAARGIEVGGALTPTPANKRRDSRPSRSTDRKGMIKKRVAALVAWER